MKRIDSQKAKLLLVLASSLLSLFSTQLQSEATAINGSGNVEIRGRGVTPPVDPENPGTEVDPGPIPSTEGPLRIDFAPILRFGQAKITEKDRIFYVQSQLFLDETTPRGNYVQITDERNRRNGWTLQLKQNTQFKNDQGHELKGAVLSLDNGWANSLVRENAPDVARETIEIDAINSVYTVATAQRGHGLGTWTIEFGASEGNQYGQKPTLTPLLDKNGEIVINEEYRQQPIYSNSAVSLKVPESTEISEGRYHTELTWIIAELPK